MTQKLTALLFFAALSLPALSFASNNEVVEIDGEKVVLFNKSTVAEIEAVLATDNSVLDEQQKIGKIDAALLADATAADGFCETAVLTYGVQGGKPAPETVAAMCIGTLDNSSFAKIIANGELMAEFPKGKSLREAISQVISRITLVLASGAP